MRIVFFFFVYGVLGWMIDTGVRSAYAKKWQPGNLLKPVPFTPIYGFGALLILALDHFLQPLDWPVKGLVFGLILAGFEAMSGIASEWFFKRRLWAYAPKKAVLGGYSDLWHVIVWGSLALLMIDWIQPFFAQVAGILGISG